MSPVPLGCFAIRYFDVAPERKSDGSWSVKILGPGSRKNTLVEHKFYGGFWFRWISGVQNSFNFRFKMWICQGVNGVTTKPYKYMNNTPPNLKGWTSGFLRDDLPKIWQVDFVGHQFFIISFRDASLVYLDVPGSQDQWLVSGCFTCL